MPKLSITAVVMLAVAALLMPLLAQATPILRLGTNVWPGYEPLYIAAEREDWERKLNVRLVEYPSASEVLRAFRNKALEAAALTLDEVLALREAGLPLKVVLVLDVSDGGDVILAKPEFRHFTDLRGRRIGVESGALGAYMITRALELNHMSLADVQIVHLDVNAQERAYLAGEIDAVVTFEPVKTRLLAAGAHQVFDSRQISGEIVDVLVVHEEFLRAQPAQVQALIAGWFRALAYREAEPELAARFTAQRIKMTPQEVVASYDGLVLPDLTENSRLLQGGLQSTLKRLQQTLLRDGLITHGGDLAELLEPGLLPH